MIGLKRSLVCEKVSLKIALAIAGFYLIHERLFEKVVTINGRIAIVYWSAKLGKVAISIWLEYHA